MPKALTGPKARARGRKPKHPPGMPKPTAQRNFTDPESRIMKGRDGFVQAYNAQAAVDAEAQVILAHHLYPPRLVRHRVAAYAASAAVESRSRRTALGGLNPCRSTSQVAL